MMLTTNNLQGLTGLRNSLTSLDSLSAQHELSSPELTRLLKALIEALNLKLTELDGVLYLTPLQTELVYSLRSLLHDPNDLDSFLQSLKRGAFVYRCSLCGHLILSKKVLLEEGLRHKCNSLKLRSRFPTLSLHPQGRKQLLGRYELLGAGPLDQIHLLSHSLLLGLDEQLRGI